MMSNPKYIAILPGKARDVIVWTDDEKVIWAMGPKYESQLELPPDDILVLIAKTWRTEYTK